MKKTPSVCTLLAAAVVALSTPVSVEAFVPTSIRHHTTASTSRPFPVATTRLSVLKDPKENVGVSTDDQSKDDTDESTTTKSPPPPPNNNGDDGDGPAATLPLRVLWSRTLDTLEDAVIHARRMPYEWGWYTPSSDDEEDQTRTVVVLGSGWAAHALLKCADNFSLRVIVVSPTNHFCFTPMLASAAVGTVEYRSMTEAVRAANPMIENYLEGQAVDVDLQAKTVQVQLESLLHGVKQDKTPPVIDVPYDTLVVSVGCKVLDNLVPGAAEHSLRLKSIDDARRLRDAVGESLEYASRPDVLTDENDENNILLTEGETEERRRERRRRVTFTLVGGGPTGVELAGELSDFLMDITRPRVGAYPRLRDDFRIVLLHGGPDLVPQFEPRLRQHALEALQSRGVEVLLNTRVQEVSDGQVRYRDKTTGQEETLDTGLCVWAAGTGPVPFVEKLLDKLPAEAKAPGGKIQVDEWMRCPMPDDDGLGSVLVLGDAAAREGGGKTNSYLPQTAQVAGQQGAYAARLLDRDYDLTQTPPRLQTDATLLRLWLQLRGLDAAPGFDFLNLGLLAYVGGGQALTEIQLGT